MRVADREADLAIRRLGDQRRVDAIAIGIRVRGVAERAALPTPADRDHGVVIVERAHGAHVHGARQALADQRRIRGLVDGHASHQLGRVLVELDAAVVAGAHQFAAVERGGGEVRRQAAHADHLRTTGHALGGDAGQAGDRFGDADVRQLADVFGRDGLDNRGRILLDVDGAFDAAADAGDRDLVEGLGVFRFLLRRAFLGLRRVRRGLRMRMGRHHHRRRRQRDAQQVSLQLHHLPLQEFV